MEREQAQQQQQSPVAESMMLPQQRGIDIRQALEILSARKSLHTHDDNSHDAAACHGHSSDDECKNMGQMIDLTKPANETITTTATQQQTTSQLEETRKLVEQQRKEREVEIKKRLSSMTVKELLQAVLEAQRERVATYRVYDAGLEGVLKTGNMTNYPSICAQATASFSVLSETIRAIMSVLEKQHQSIHALLGSLQEHERQKLNTTAALHLEQLRERNERQQDDEQTSRLLREGVVALKRQVGECVEAINEVLEELRYALADEEE